MMTEQACNTSDIAGCRFTLSAMTDEYVNVIKGALEESDTSKVWKKTNDVSTCVRGKISHVFDVTKAIFLHAAKTGKHVTFSGTFSIGCPGDTEGDVYLEENDEVMNTPQTEKIDQYVAADFALYPLGGGNYMDVIYGQIEEIKRQGINVSSVHYATKLEGDTNNIFNGLEQVFTKTKESGSSHTVMTVTMSANSPSHK